MGSPLAIKSGHGGKYMAKPIHFVLAMLLAIAGITVYVLMADVPVDAVGISHPDIPGMSLGGEGASKLSALGLAPFYFQIAVILLAGGLLYMGIAEHRRDAFLKVVMAAGIAFALFVWAMLFFGYLDYTQSGQTTIVMGFPAPTVWLFWGVWGSFALFDVFYTIAFFRYFLPPEDEAAFEALVAEVKADEGQS